MLLPFDIANTRRTLLSAIIEAAGKNGGRVIAADASRDTMTYRQLLTRAFVLGAVLPPLPPGEGRGEGLSSPAFNITPAAPPSPYPLPEGEGIAMLLPNANAAAITFVALHMLGKVPCMLNFSSGEANILHACRIACARVVITSRKFIELGKLEHIAAALEKEYQVIYLEDVRAGLTLFDKLGGLVKSFFPRVFLRGVLNTNPDDPAVILYTSGSEGVPKGVALSHANILANIFQSRAILDLHERHVVFNALPVFHSFGLTVGMLMPLVCGLKIVFYPSPVQYKQIPKEVHKSGATVMLGTDTFYQGYAKYGEPRDFEHVTLAVAGAEKLKESTRRPWAEQFNVEILQGYGVTEASPIISVNRPGAHKPGTVGLPLPGIECRLDPVEGIKEGGRLFVKGPNVMLGYLKADKPGVIQPQGEWYDTGDIVDIDANGFISILGRAKRFAKIAGEMVSLTAVEELAAAVEPEAAHAAVAVADERKGEQVALYTESRALTRDRLAAEARARGFPDIALPRRVLFMEQIPRLGSGKIDYPALLPLPRSGRG